MDTQRDWLRKSARLAVMLALVLGALGSSCPSRVLKDGLMPDPTSPEQCPHYFVWIADTGGQVGLDTLREVPSSGPITDIPEYHDCQQFIVADGNRRLSYDGHVYAIYAALGLARLDTVLDSLQALAAPGDVPAAVAATIVTRDGTYEQLGILPGFNCLYLSRVGGTWGAWLVPKGPRDAVCEIQTAVNRAPQVRRLVASPVPPAKPLSGLDVPPVTRWDWDAGGLEQYIGVRCGGAWCQVGDDASASQPVVATPAFSNVEGLPPSSNAEVRRVTDIKGWHDAQILAARLPNGQLTPSGVWGVITPHPSLDQHTLETYSERWVHIATAVVTADYKGKVLTLTGLGTNDIFLCMAPKGTVPTEACDMPDPGPKCGTMVASVPQDHTTWWIRVEYDQIGSETWEYHCVERRTPSNPEYGSIPGTARWRWLVNDETTWTRCEQGCCQNQ